MTYYISREALFKTVEDYASTHPVISDNELFALFCSIPAADVRPVGWIPVTERLPESGERVLVSNGKGFVCEAYLSERKRWMRHGCIVDYITPTYWMPLPEPPKEDEHG